MKKILIIIYLISTVFFTNNIAISNEYSSIGLNEDKVDFNFECIGTDKEIPGTVFNFGFKNIETSSMPKYMADGTFIENKLHFLRKSLNTNKYKAPVSRVYDFGEFNYNGVKYLNLKMFFMNFPQDSDGGYGLARYSLLLKTNLEYQLEMASLRISKELYEILQKNKKDRIDLIKKKEFDLLPDNIVKYTDIIFDFIQQGTESDIEFNFSFNCKKI